MRRPMSQSKTHDPAHDCTTDLIPVFVRFPFVTTHRQLLVALKEEATPARAAVDDRSCVAGSAHLNRSVYFPRQLVRGRFRARLQGPGPRVRTRIRTTGPESRGNASRRRLEPGEHPPGFLDGLGRSQQKEHLPDSLWGSSHPAVCRPVAGEAGCSSTSGPPRHAFPLPLSLLPFPLQRPTFSSLMRTRDDGS